MIALSVALLMLIPLSAPAQTLSAEVHPGLLFSAAEVPQLVERIQREPYASWWQTVLARAQSTPPTFTEERSKVRFAKALAFAWLMTDDSAFAARALAVMQQVAFPPRGGDLGEPHNEGEVVAQYAVACDILHSYAAANDPQALEEIRAILAEEADRLWEGIVISEVDLGLVKLTIRLHETPHIDNWHIRAYGGLGLAAMALSDHPGGKATPQQWADRAFAMVKGSLDFQIEEVDGGYAEGPFYSRYAADVYLPYMFALRARTGLDLFADPRIEKMHNWSLNLRLPNGRRPNIDDGHLNDFYGHYLAAVYPDGGVHRWDWENNERGLYVREFSEMDAIALYDDSVPAMEPEHGPSVFMPGAGDAVFRSDWSAGATYMLLRGEHGVARAKGFSHEHADETSFVLYAGGEMLAVDAGYINFANHDKVNEGRNHNVVLVDGQGPPRFTALGQTIGGGNDAFIRDSFTSAAGDYSEVDARYQDVELKRRVFFVDRDYFVVADEIDSGGDEHGYEWRLHGNGGGDSGGSYDRLGGVSRWVREGAELLAFLPETPGRTFVESDTIHSFDYLEEQTHTVLRVQQRGADGRYLAVLYPRATGAAEPGFAAVGIDGGEAVLIEPDVTAPSLEPGSLLDLVWISNGDAVSVAVAATSALLSSDAAFGYARYDGQTLVRFSLQDATGLTVGGAAFFSASDTIDASVKLSAERFAGFVRGPGTGYQVSLPLAGRTLDEASFTGELLGTVVEGDLLTLNLAGEGDLDLRFSQPPVVQLHVVGRTGWRTGLSPFRTRVGRPMSFEVFSFTAEDSSDLAPITDYEWEVPAALGKVTALGEMTLTTVSGVREDIVFRAGGAEATFNISVTPHSVRAVVIEPSSVNLEPGERYTFRARALDRYGNVVPRSFGWHVVGGIGTIDSRTGSFIAGDTGGEGWV
ncbi:MAG: heparinase II/III family protein, partial [Candidatus Latescibacterota bacterium]|nr:heparinase II/III family protein [Candidatus Latescibacterota bacterium]